MNNPIGVPLQYGFAITPDAFTNNQDILTNFTGELAHIRTLVMELNSLAQYENISMLDLQEDIIEKASSMVTIHEHLSNLFIRIRNILEPAQGLVAGGKKKRKTKRRRL